MRLPSLAIALWFYGTQCTKITGKLSLLSLRLLSKRHCINSDQFLELEAGCIRVDVKNDGSSTSWLFVFKVYFHAKQQYTRWGITSSPPSTKWLNFVIMLFFCIYITTIKREILLHTMPLNFQTSITILGVQGRSRSSMLVPLERPSAVMLW